MLTRDLQDLQTVKASTMSYPDSMMSGEGFATLRLEFETTAGDRLTLTLFGETAESLISTVKTAVETATRDTFLKAA